MNNSNPLSIPQLLAPLWQSIKNETWDGRRIVPRTLEFGEKRKQYSENTTELSKAFAEMMHQYGIQISPMKMDHVINGYTGNLYRRVMGAMATTMDITRVRPDQDMSTIPIVGTFFVPVGQSRVPSEFYFRVQELGQKRSSGTATLAEIGEYNYGQRLSKELTPLWEARREAFRDNNMRTAAPIALKHLQKIQQMIKDYQQLDKEQFREQGINLTLRNITDPNAEPKAVEAGIKLLQEEGLLLHDMARLLRKNFSDKTAQTRIDALRKRWRRD
jgi:hypothetical protein